VTSERGSIAYMVAARSAVPVLVDAITFAPTTSSGACWAGAFG